MTRKIISRRILAGFAATTLAVGLAACSEAEEGVDSAESAVQDAGDALSGDGNGEGADAGDDTIEVENVDGETFQVPAALGEAINTHSADFGTPTEIEEGADGRYLVSYEEDSYLTYSDEAGAQPLVGMIAQTWAGEGGLDSGLGVATEPEETVPGGRGWTQDFVNGTISWVPDDNGEFGAEIEQN